MDQKLDNDLCEKYPLIFKDRHAPMTETCMVWGFSCGDGWYNIIDTLCELLNRKYSQASRHYDYVLEYSTKPKQWGDKKPYTAEELAEAKAEMETEEKKVPYAVQVKEKFGGLRFYISGATEEHYNYVSFAETMSYVTCDECGAPGTLYTEGWHKTRCDKHADT